MDSTPQGHRPEIWRVAAKWTVFIALVTGVYLGGSWLTVAVENQFMPWYDAYGKIATALVVVLYVLLMALPFVPGIEISLALLMIFGVEGVGIVYGATLAALTLAFLVGRLVPLRWLARLMAWLHFQRGARLVEHLAPLEAEAKFHLLVDAAPLRFIPFLLRHRYLAVAAAFNIPGNAIIGGGGGIALIAGMSGLFRLPAYILMVGIAISPIPLFILGKAFFWPEG